ncbi:hypothetical protein [Evansella tamaricis]|uniref:Uncharacterized protein n=1 Tax=Evansella tamaricis TaxID=2069301 RepID=A0ABS6JLP2_9BACI|nr:hypothetical protein [Evansella tamaricis]MBU9714453.1 hypothetical protein [Evansella tamaricis]
MTIDKNEKEKLFDEPRTWTDEEKVGFAEVLLMFIASNDLSYDLYKHLADIRTSEDTLPYLEHTGKFEKLLHKELIELGELEFYEQQYQKKKEEYMIYKLANAQQEGVVQ